MFPAQYDWVPGIDRGEAAEIVRLAAPVVQVGATSAMSSPSIIYGRSGNFNYFKEGIP
jgi:hypothetical protein